MLYCLVDRQGRIYPKIDGWPELNVILGIREKHCLKCYFDPETRRITYSTNCPFLVTEGHRQAAENFFRTSFTPEKLIDYALGGYLSDTLMLGLLAPEKRAKLLFDFVGIAGSFTKKCNLRDSCPHEDCPYLESQSICFRPVLESALSYKKSCAEAWARIFKDPRNRIPAWR